MHLIKDIIFSPKSKLLTHLLFSLSAILMFTTCQGDGSHGKTDILIPSNTTMAVIMADSEMHRLGDSLSFGYPEAKWNYQIGLFLKALLDVALASPADDDLVGEAHAGLTNVTIDSGNQKFNFLFFAATKRTFIYFIFCWHYFFFSRSKISSIIPYSTASFAVIQ